MNPFVLEQTDFTPKVIFDPEKGQFEISGFSRPENVIGFYRPILHWLKDYYENELSQNTHFKQSQITLNMKLSYFNSASSKFLLDVIMEFVGFHNKGNVVTINWHFEKEDEEILESGEEISDMIGFPFNFIPYESL